MYMKKLFGLGALVAIVACLVLSSCEPKELSIEKELTMYVDSTYQLTVDITPANATGRIHWKSSDTAVVTVDNSGLLKAIKKGAAVVTANVGNTIAICNVTVLNNPVTLELKMLDIEQKKCTVNVKPSDEEGYYFCGYELPANLDKLSDAEITETILKYYKSMLEQYAAYGYNYTLKDVLQLQQGEKNLIASGLTANTDYVMFAFGVDIESETASKVVTRLPFKTKEVVPSSMTFKIELDSIAKVRTISKGDTTYSYTGYFKCTPSNEKEPYVFNGATAKVLDSLYNNDPMQYLTEMEAYYDANYSSYGGFEGTMVKAGTRDIYASKMVHGTKYILIAAGYAGGFSTKPTTFEYTFLHPDSTKNPMPMYREPVLETADEIDFRDFRGVYFPGVCH